MGKQTSAASVLVLCAVAGAGCGGSGGVNVITGATSGGAVHLVIDDGSGSGVEPSHVPATLITVLAQDPSSGAVEVFVGGYVDEGNGFAGKQWQIVFAVDSAPAAGNAYTITPTPNTTLPNTDAAISFEEDHNELADWTGDGGTISVTSLAGTLATFQLSTAAMSPASGSATGPFTFDGQIVVDLSNLCNCSD